MHQAPRSSATENNQLRKFVNEINNSILENGPGISAGLRSLFETIPKCSFHLLVLQDSLVFAAEEAGVDHVAVDAAADGERDTFGLAANRQRLRTKNQKLLLFPVP